MRHASLFSGIGGFDLAAQWMGWENVFQLEIDNWCRKKLAKHFPSTLQYLDIKEFNGLTYEHSIDIISGGFPCQPFSQAGQQRGTEDDRYLWPEMLRVISEIKPTWVVGENVPGIIQMAQFDSQPPMDSEGNPIGNPGDTFTHRGHGILGKDILESLKKEGYVVQPFVISACAVNAIHRRDRVWILAYSHSNARLRKSRKNASPSSKERLQERNEIHNTCQSDKIQSDNVPNTTSTGLEGATGKIEKNGSNGFASKSRFKLKWPISQPTICRGDDGVSYRLDDGTMISSKEKIRALEGLGNAVVPQEVYEIFRIIEKFMKEEKG